MKKYLIIVFCCFFFSANSMERKGNEIIFSTSSGIVKISFCTSDMFRVQMSKNEVFPDNEKWMVRKYSFLPIKMLLKENDNDIQIFTDRLHLVLFKDTFRIKVMDCNDKILYEEIGHSAFNSDTVRTNVTLNSSEHFFGFGERMDFLDQRGHNVYLNVGLGHGDKPAIGGKDILKSNYCPVPFMMSTMGYGIFFHTNYATNWDMGWSNDKQYSFSAVKGDLDYYFIYGPDLYKIIDRYTDLTGKSPMLPKFAMGLHVGTYSGGTWKYENKTSDSYPVELCKKLRHNKIPFDILWLDSTWRLFCSEYGNGGCCFEWRKTFKNPEAMFKGCYDQHVQMMGLHIRSFLDNGPKYHLLDAAKKEGYVLYQNGSGIVDFFNPKAVDWWWNNAVMKVASIGAKFVKTDVGDALNDPDLHNIFPLAYAEAPYLKFENYNKMRGLTQTREGYAGIQRYPYIWAGDWGSEWQWFEPVIRGGLNIGMSGVGNWTHCMGGFEQYSPYDTELYTRWVQFGMFSPISLLFGMDHPRYHEPWTYGKDALDNFVKYDSLRYTLVPYIYSNEYQLYKTGRPMITPLVMDYPKDENTYNISRQYMFGPWMMICPVTTKGALSQVVYFPGGTWFEYETGKRIDGRQYKSFLTPLDVLPIYIKGGAIIPQQPVMQWIDEKRVNLVSLDVYPMGKSSFDLYEDDGRSLNYKNDIFALTHITSTLEKNSWKLFISKPDGLYSPDEHRYLIKAYLDVKPEMITENGKNLEERKSIKDVRNISGWFYDKLTNRLWIKTNCSNRQNINIATQ